MKIYLFKNLQFPTHTPLKVRASNYRNAIKVIKGFVAAFAYVGEQPCQ